VREAITYATALGPIVGKPAREVSRAIVRVEPVKRKRLLTKRKRGQLIRVFGSEEVAATSLLVVGAAFPLKTVPHFPKADGLHRSSNNGANNL
jgi:hypothetical protein